MQGHRSRCRSTASAFLLACLPIYLRNLQVQERSEELLQAQRKAVEDDAAPFCRTFGPASALRAHSPPRPRIGQCAPAAATTTTTTISADKGRRQHAGTLSTQLRGSASPERDAQQGQPKFRRRAATAKREDESTSRQVWVACLKLNASGC